MIEWSGEVEAYQFLCPWGCFDYGFDTEDQSREAFDSHVCVAQQAEPCS